MTISNYLTKLQINYEYAVTPSIVVYLRHVIHLFFPQVILKMNSNTVAWNPMEASTFTAANEDYK